MPFKNDPSAPSSAVKKKTPPCRKACPAGIDVPRYVRHIGRGDFDGALAVIRERIPFPAVCGYACVHPCEAKCSRRQYDEAIAIRMLKRAAEEHGRGDTLPARFTRKSGKKVAVIGSGPCGLTAAHYLSGLGHAVTVFEALPMPGGMLRYGIPGYRLPNAVVDREIEAIRSRGVDIRTNAPVTSARELLAKGFHAVLVASGAWRPLKMGIEGENSPMICEGVSFLREINSGRQRPLGSIVVVVGGGNTAIDAARASVRTGAKTLLLYRRNREDMPALPEEVADAEAEGVRILCLTTPIRVAENEIICTRMTPGPVDASGRKKPIPVFGSEFSLACDAVVMAIGQSAEAGATQLEGNSDGTAKVDALSRTPVQGIFAAGDAVSGPKTIIDAIAQGRLASVAMDRYLGGKGVIDPQSPSQTEAAPPAPAPVAAARQQPLKLPAGNRINGFDLVEIGFHETTAMAEAKRCLSCDLNQYRVEINPSVCKGCGYCLDICRLEVFSFSDAFNAAGYKPAAVKDPDRCVGCLKCVYVCPDFAITLGK